jgi:hypothetical protein
VLPFAALLFFFFFALVALFIHVDNGLGRLGLWAIALILALLAVYFLLILSVLAMRVEVGPKLVRVRVPNWRSPSMPGLPWVRAELPYSDVAAVETRDEVYSSFGLIMLQTAYSIVSKAGRRIVLGSGVMVTDRGAVRMGGITPAIVRGTPSWDTASMSADERVAAQGKAAKAMQFAFVFVVIALSIRACMQH